MIRIFFLLLFHISVNATFIIPVRIAESTSVSVSGCWQIVYQTVLLIDGNPFRVLVDTGSTTIAIASIHCDSSCNGISPRYSPKGSRIAGALATYGDGSFFTGSVHSASINVGTLPAVTANIVAIETQGGTEGMTFFSTGECTFDKQIFNYFQGIFGLAFPAIAVSSTDSFVDNLIVQQPIVEDSVAVQLCLTGGYFFIGGGYDLSTIIGPVHWAPLTKIGASFTYYSAIFLSASLGSTSLGIDSSGWNVDGQNPVFDCGTSLIIWPSAPSQAFASILDAFPAWADSPFTPSGTDFLFNRFCIFESAYTSDELNADFPTLTIQLQNSSHVSIRPFPGWLMPSFSDSGILLYCSGIVPVQSNLPVIMGIPFHVQNLVIFDRTLKRVGLAPQNTSLPCPPFNVSDFIFSGSPLRHHPWAYVPVIGLSVFMLLWSASS